MEGGGWGKKKQVKFDYRNIRYVTSIKTKALFDVVEYTRRTVNGLSLYRNIMFTGNLK